MRSSLPQDILGAGAPGRVLPLTAGVGLQRPLLKLDDSTSVLPAATQPLWNHRAAPWQAEGVDKLAVPGHYFVDAIRAHVDRSVRRTDCIVVRRQTCAMRAGGALGRRRYSISGAFVLMCNDPCRKVDASALAAFSTVGTCSQRFA